MREPRLRSNHWLWKTWSGMERAAAGEDKSCLSSCDSSFYPARCSQTGHLSIYTNTVKVELQQAAIRFLVIGRQ